MLPEPKISDAIDPTLLGACRGAAILAGQVNDATPWALYRLVYTYVYAGGFVGRGAIPAELAMGAVSDSAFVNTLFESISDRHITGPLRVLDRSGDTVCVDFLGVRAEVADFDDELSADAKTVFVRVAALSVGLSPGFVTRTGRSGPPQAPMSRLYLNINPQQASEVLGSLSRRLDACDVQFVVKVLAHPSMYFRADSAVLYLPSVAVGDGLREAGAWLETRGLRLASGVPLLTLQAREGVGVADEPDDVPAVGHAHRLSHGMLVTRWLMRAIRHSTDPESMVRMVLEEIRNLGRDPSQPHKRRSD